MKHFKWIKLLGLAALIAPESSFALMPVEGILMGEAVTEIQTDPLSLVFTDAFDKSENIEFKKLKNYQALTTAGVHFGEICSNIAQSTYSTPWREQQAKRSVTATLQYIGLSTAIEAIGAYANKLMLDENQYKNLSENLVSQYCSENISVMSLRTVRKSLEHYYRNPNTKIIPEIIDSPFATEAFKNGVGTSENRSREFHYAIRNFRAFCSWGGSSDDYRMLTPYLRNPFIMGLVEKNLSGFRFSWNEESKKMEWKKDDATAVRVVCRDLICRPSDKASFEKEFPLSTGSTGISTDVNKLYCQHFRYLDYDQRNTTPEVKEWIKAQEIEDPIMESSFFISLMTGVPDPFFTESKYTDIPGIVKSSVDERWTKWSRDTLGVLSKTLLFEESLKVKAQPRRVIADIKDDLILDFHVTLGEMDRLMRDNDKIGLSFDFRFSKSWLKSLITKHNYLAENIDVEGEKEFRADIARYIDLQLRTKEKLFNQKLWNEDFSRLLADELLAQILSYRGGYFADSKDEIVTVPVRFNYGIFAMSYMRFRFQVSKGSTELNL